MTEFDKKHPAKESAPIDAGAQLNLEMAKVSAADLVMERLALHKAGTEEAPSDEARKEELIQRHCDQVVSDLIVHNPEILRQTVTSLKNEDAAMTPYLLASLANYGAEGIEIVKAATSHVCAPLALVAVCEITFRDREQGGPLMKQFIMRPDLDGPAISATFAVIERLGPDLMFALRVELQTFITHADAGISEQAGALIMQGKKWFTRAMVSQLQRLLENDGSVSDSPQEAQARQAFHKLWNRTPTRKSGD